MKITQPEQILSVIISMCLFHGFPHMILTGFNTDLSFTWLAEHKITRKQKGCLGHMPSDNTILSAWLYCVFINFFLNTPKIQHLKPPTINSSLPYKYTAGLETIS